MSDDGNGMTFSFTCDVVLNSEYEITYTYTDANGCANSTVQTVYVMGMPNTVTDIQRTNIKLFPNPTTGHIQMTNIEADQIQVFDSVGRLVFSVKQPGTSIDISAAPAGMYFLKITAGGKVYSARVVKE